MLNRRGFLKCLPLGLLGLTMPSLLMGKEKEKSEWEKPPSPDYDFVPEEPVGISLSGDMGDGYHYVSLSKEATNPPSGYVNISSTTTYHLVGYTTSQSGGGLLHGAFKAIRIR